MGKIGEIRVVGEIGVWDTKTPMRGAGGVFKIVWTLPLGVETTLLVDRLLRRPIR